MPANDLTATEAAARIRAGTLTSEALVRACLDRIEARERDVQAWQYLDPDAALAAARAADRAPSRGALHGVPIAVKDIIDTADMPTGLGSPLYATRQPQWDASCVAAARAAGAIMMGKTVTTEFAHFTAGKTRNPHNIERTPGGSSSGSAAAVADRMVPLAFGSQTAGSLIRPATFCGIIGYKPTYGDFSLSGIRPFAESLDTLGVLARSVDDIALLSSVLAGLPARAVVAPLPAPPVLGLCLTPQGNAADASVHAVLAASAEKLRRAGATVRDVVLPPEFTPLVDAQKTIMAYEAARNYVFETTRHLDGVTPAFAAFCETGWHTRHEDYVAAKAAVAQAAAMMRAAFAGCDALVTPAAAGEPPLAAAGTGDPLFCRMWTALHLPCLAVPAGSGPAGLPIGIQLVGLHGADAALLSVGRWVDSALATA